MGECMYFPENWEEFIEEYSFKDKDEIYTNGSQLITVFRVKQMMDHYSKNKENNSLFKLFKCNCIEADGEETTYLTIGTENDTTNMIKERELRNSDRTYICTFIVTEIKMINGRRISII